MKQTATESNQPWQPHIQQPICAPMSLQAMSEAQPLPGRCRELVLTSGISEINYSYIIKGSYGYYDYGVILTMPASLPLFGILQRNDWGLGGWIPCPNLNFSIQNFQIPISVHKKSASPKIPAWNDDEQWYPYVSLDWTSILFGPNSQHFSSQGGPRGTSSKRRRLDGVVSSVVVFHHLWVNVVTQ